jgi:AAA domain
MKPESKNVVDVDSRCVEAIYCKNLKLPEYRENPLISALGPLLETNDLLPQLCNMIPFSSSERGWSQEERIHAMGRLSKLCLSRGCVGMLASQINLLIRQHYVDRDPRKSCTSTSKNYYKLNKEGKIVALYEHSRSHSGCMGIFGISGVGKTTAVLTVLRFFPQIIRHKKLGIVQVVWIKVQCAKGALLKDTLLQLLETYDNLLATHYKQEMGRNPTIPELCNKVARVARRHHTGLIWIDEIQHAFRAAARHDPYLDFFTNFTNVVGVPILLTGTPTLQPSEKDSLRLERRMCSAGRWDWEPFSEAEWEYVCNILEAFQWVKNPRPLSHARRRTLWNLSQGIGGILMPLYQLSQIASVRSGVEQLTCNLFKDVSKKLLAPVQPMIAAIRSGNRAVMRQYDDILSSTIEDLIRQAESETNAIIFRKQLESENASEARMIAVSRLIPLGLTQDVAFQYVTAVGKDAPLKSAEQLTHDALALFFTGTAPPRRTSRKGFPTTVIQ